LESLCGIRGRAALQAHSLLLPKNSHYILATKERTHLRPKMPRVYFVGIILDQFRQKLVNSECFCAVELRQVLPFQNIWQFI
jgi:hypothetical protein